MSHRATIGRRRDRAAVGLLLLLTLTAGLAACDSSAARQATPGGSATTSGATGESSRGGAVEAVPLSDRVQRALVGATGFGTFGYRDGTGLASPTGPTMQVCNRVLEIDGRAQTRVAAARTWRSDNAIVMNAVYGYPRASAADGVRQIRDAAGSCSTYRLSVGENSWGGVRQYTLAAPVTLPSHDGVEASFAFCEQVKQGNDSRISPYAQCWSLLARDEMLSVLFVYWNGQQTAPAFDELSKLTPAAAEALRAG